MWACSGGAYRILTLINKTALSIFCHCGTVGLPMWEFIGTHAYGRHIVEGYEVRSHLMMSWTGWNRDVFFYPKVELFMERTRCAFIRCMRTNERIPGFPPETVFWFDGNAVCIRMYPTFRTTKCNKIHDNTATRLLHNQWTGKMLEPAMPVTWLWMNRSSLSYLGTHANFERIVQLAKIKQCAKCS